MRTVLALLSTLVIATPAIAQESGRPGAARDDGEAARAQVGTPSEPAVVLTDAPREPALGRAAVGAEDAEPTGSSAGEAGAGEAGAGASERARPKLAVVVAGDPDPQLREAARRVERASGEHLRLPFDPGLRAALRGEPAEGDDGLEDARRERRRLGGDEARDAPVIAALGRRAGADVVGVVRAGEDGPELVVLDVRHAAFFEGTLALSADVADARIARFVRSRARASARGAEAPEAAAGTPAPEGATDGTAQPARQPDFFEQFWPYFVAGGLLAALLIGIAVTSATAGSNTPVLRFVPGGP